jgi:hypothetical protein
LECGASGEVARRDAVTVRSRESAARPRRTTGFAYLTDVLVRVHRHPARDVLGLAPKTAAGLVPVGLGLLYGKSV